MIVFFFENIKLTKNAVIVCEELSPYPQINVRSVSAVLSRRTCSISTWNAPSCSSSYKKCSRDSTCVNDEFEWLKQTMTSGGDITAKLQEWNKAPGARIAHPREEHLIPLLMTAAAGGGSNATPQIIYDVLANNPLLTAAAGATPAENGEHAISGYLFP
jgi:hypothetical protein